MKTFSKPIDVIDFIKECLNEDKSENLYSVAIEETSDFWKEKIFEDFKKLNDQNLLEEVFLAKNKVKKFPFLSKSLSLGGCDQANKHLNIDLVKQKGNWVLKRIWKCR